MGTCPGNRTRSVPTNEIAQTPLEVSIEGSRTLISHLPSALIINHQSVLNSHPTRRCQVCIRLSLGKEWRGVVRSINAQIYSDVDQITPDPSFAKEGNSEHYTLHTLLDSLDIGACLAEDCPVIAKNP